MTNEIQYSDEFLNAYLDNELSSSDKACLLKAVRQDEELSHRLCQLQRVKNMVQLAYHDVTPQLEDQPEPARKKSSASRYAIAATVLLMLGAVSGWLAHKQFFNQPGLTEIAREFRTNSPNNGAPWKLMVQVSSNDKNRYNVLINETERLLKTAQQNKEQVVIQILANSKGLDILKDDNTQIALKMRQLSRQYDNLILTACGQTLKKLRLKNRQIPKLLTEASIVHSALQEAIEKQKQGWTYIKI